MAARYWIGGAGTWSSANTANWSATSGGAGGASVPGSADTPIFDANSGSGVVTFTNGGVAVGIITINNANIELSLGAALVQVGSLSLVAGTFTTNNYNYTGLQFNSSNSNTRTINLGSSTVTLSGTTPIVFTSSFGLTFNAGTSQINCSATTWSFNGGGQTFYNVSFTSNAQTAQTINGANTFNNLTIAGRTSAGVNSVGIAANQTINGTLTLSAGTNATMRTFMRGSVIGTSYTLTCAAVASLTDIDFRDITIAGAAAPVSGTRLGDCKGNSGITFPAAKTVWWLRTSNFNWGDNAWSATEGGSLDLTQFPLAQDTVIFSASTYPLNAVTVTINAAYNIGTIDMSARTSNTMTLATGSTTPAIYGNWINGTGTTLTGTSNVLFAGRNSQTITSAGITFPQGITLDTPSGSVTLQDAFTTSRPNVASITLTSGAFYANGYNVTTFGVVTNNSNTRTIAIGVGTWTVSGSGSPWQASPPTNLTVTGTGTISLTSASAKTFAGSGIQTYPTINQGGTGTLTITGSNKFANITNTAIGRVQFTGGTTNEFTSFTLSGSVGTPLQLGSTNTTQAILKKPTSWQMGLLSTDAGNNTGLTFLSTDGTMEYLSVSYINGQTTSTPTSTIYYGSTNVTTLYYGNTPVTSVYYGSTQVF